MAEEAKVAIAVMRGEVAEIAASVPAESMAGKLSRVASAGLDRLEEIVNHALDWDDVKQVRLIGDMSLGSCKLLQRAAEAELQGQRVDRIGEILERLARAGGDPVDG